jgi:hypothetical protein
MQDGYEYLHSNGTKEEAMIVEFKLTNQKQGDYAMINLGKAGDIRNPAAANPPSYISYKTVGEQTKTPIKLSPITEPRALSR